LNQIETIVRSSLKEYIGYVTKSRVLPYLDLKPVHKRIIWACIKENARFGKGRFKKSASVIGTTLHYHPHGTASVYGAMQSLVNSPNALLTGRGNWSSIYGDSAAAERYTEVRTSELFEHVLDDYMFKIGEFVHNYDETELEPLMFQTKVPLPVLVSVSGIGVALTTSTPALYIDTIKDILLKEIDALGRGVKKKYAYGGVYYNNRIYPKTEIVTLDNKTYLKITDFPITSNIRILSSSDLIHELLSSKQIEVINKSELGKAEFYIRAPEVILNQIVQSISLPLIENFAYYYKRLRVSDFFSNWLTERLKFIKRREYYKHVNIFQKEIEKEVLKILSKELSLRKIDDFPSLVDKVCDDIYDKHCFSKDENINEFLISKSDFKKNIKNKSLSSINKATDININIPKFQLFGDTEVKNIFIDELKSLDTKLFSKASLNKNIADISKFNSIKLKRYIAIRPYEGIEVKYNKISRMVNWESEEDILVIYENGTIEKLSNTYFGLKTNENLHIVGFTFYRTPTVVITESNLLSVFVRISAVKELIKAAFPATEIEVDGKIYTVNSNLALENVKSYKVTKTK